MDNNDNMLKREKTKSNIFKQEFMDLTNEIQDQQKELQSQAKENNVSKNKHVLSKILNSEEDLSEVPMRDIIKDNVDKNKTKKDLQNIAMQEPSDLSNKKVKGLDKDNLQSSDTKTSTTEFKCTFDGCVRSFKTVDELNKHVSIRHKDD